MIRVARRPHARSIRMVAAVARAIHDSFVMSAAAVASAAGLLGRAGRGFSVGSGKRLIGLRDRRRVHRLGLQVRVRLAPVRRGPGYEFVLEGRLEQVIVELLDQFEHGKISRRQLVQNLMLGMAAASAGAPALAASAPRHGFKAVAVNHISYGSADYKRTRDFYADLLGMRVSEDTGEQCALSFGQSFIIARKSRQPDGAPYIDHIAYTIADWDRAAVEAELRRRGLEPKADTDDSFLVKDPNGYMLQIAGKNMKAAQT